MNAGVNVLEEHVEATSDARYKMCVYLGVLPLQGKTYYGVVWLPRKTALTGGLFGGQMGRRR